MKKIAIFVEGQTEQLFVQKLLEQVIGGHNLYIENVKIVGRVGSRNLLNINIASNQTSKKYYFLIFDCSGDATVKSDILERFRSLKNASYSFIIGLRDVFPETDIVGLRRGLNYRVPNDPDIPISITLAIMEIEAWFIAEENHFSVLSPKLNVGVVNSLVGFDITNNSTETIQHPFATLNQIYHHAGLAYKKRKNTVNRTIDSIDYFNLFFQVRKRNSSLNHFLTNIELSIS